MITRPWLSVLMPTYNGEAFLRSALDSILLQGDPAIECIAVDDGSTDATLSILAEYSNRISLRIERRRRTGNWVKSTNFALARARGEYVCFLHQDDLWLGGRLSAFRQLAREHPDVDWFLSSCYFVDGAGKRCGIWRCPLPAVPHRIDRDFLLERLLVQNFIPIPGPMFKRARALTIGGMIETAWYTADWDFWLRLAESADAMYLAQPTAAFRLHAQSQTVTRSAHAADFRSQHQMIAETHMAMWRAGGWRRERVRKLSALSIEIDTALANMAHGEKVRVGGVLRSLWAIGPTDVVSYLNYSRIWERATARLRARLGRVPTRPESAR